MPTGIMIFIVEVEAPMPAELNSSVNCSMQKFRYLNHHSTPTPTTMPTMERVVARRALVWRLRAMAGARK